MRFFVVGTLLVLVLSGLGVWMRPKEKAVSNVLFGFAVVFAFMLVAAFYGWV